MRFQDFPIKRKLVAVIVLTSLTVLSIAFATLLAYEIHSYRQAGRRLDGREHERGPRVR